MWSSKECALNLVAKRILQVCMFLEGYWRGRTIWHAHAVRVTRDFDRQLVALAFDPDGDIGDVEEHQVELAVVGDRAAGAP